MEKFDFVLGNFTVISIIILYPRNTTELFLLTFVFLLNFFFSQKASVFTFMMLCLCPLQQYQQILAAFDVYTTLTLSWLA